MIQKIGQQPAQIFAAFGQRIQFRQRLGNVPRQNCPTQLEDLVLRRQAEHGQDVSFLDLVTAKTDQLIQSGFGIAHPAVGPAGDVPVLVLRGQLSDILSAAAAKKMAKGLPYARLVEVSGVGHAPTMDEAEARAAIDAWIAELPSA